DHEVAPRNFGQHEHAAAANIQVIVLYRPDIAAGAAGRSRLVPTNDPNLIILVFKLHDRHEVIAPITRVLPLSCQIRPIRVVDTLKSGSGCRVETARQISRGSSGSPHSSSMHSLRYTHEALLGEVIRLAADDPPAAGMG